ncbi:MAG TPA: phosphoribosyltransferase [Gemmatimonadaceae bacterium]|nr:phosphoribosyltransferase [Gemmatimonadaceae bacterium]
MARFHNRRDAGRSLGALLRTYASVHPLVLGLPRGGVPVAFEVARALDAQLDIFVVRKLGVPGHEELAMGAVASGGAVVMNDDVVAQAGVSRAEIERILAMETREIQRRETLYRAGGNPPAIAGHHVILVDDGIATGASMLVAVQALRAHGPRSITVAVPVASRAALMALRNHADDWACVMTPEPFHGVGAWYDDFSQTTDAEVRELLARAPSENHLVPR